jgi:8-oxo-dGTP pyrophosphatase MutT (NUDIX family)
VTIWIDPPAWPAHGRLWSHLVSDVGYEELHAFAASVGVPARGFEGDHYDVPEETYAAIVAAGAHETSTRDLLARLQRAGLRLRKMKGERGVARLQGVRLADGSVADVDLVRSPRWAPDQSVFAVMVVLSDDRGHYAVVYSPRREEWSVPGGGREEGETPAQCAQREVREETGLVVPLGALEPWGYERFTPVSAGGRWPAGGGVLQVLTARLSSAPRALVASEPDVVDPRWVSPAEFEALAGARFWWPLVAPALGARPATGWAH